MLASAAIPTLFRAIHVDGGAYWDGLFSQNPPVAPLLDDDPDELWVVQINPTRRDDEPRTTLDIADRRNELAGNLSLYQELASIEKIDQLLAAGTLTAASGYRQVAVRVLELTRSPVTGLLGAASKVNRDVAFLRDLRRRGGEQADVFLTSLRFEGRGPGATSSALRALLIGARLEVEAPFGRATDDVAVLLATGVTRDVTRKELVGEEVTWRVARTGRPACSPCPSPASGSSRCTSVRCRRTSGEARSRGPDPRSVGAVRAVPLAIVYAVLLTESPAAC